MRERWGSRLGFVLATAGFSVGLGNIWRFPYLVGESGGGAFLVVYLTFAILIGVPLMTAEISLGRKSGLTPIAGMERLTGSKRSPWNLIGWLGIVAAVLITSYYVMLIAWLLAYLGMTVAGADMGSTPEETRRFYEEFIAAPGPVIACAAAVIVFMALVVRRGVARGIERMAKLLMPLLVVLLVGLAVRGLSYPGAGAGLVWYLKPELSELTGSSVLAALGQAFYSIGIGMAVAFGLGSYLPEKSDVPGNAAIVVAADTGIALVAGLIVFPALFAFGMHPDQGPGLLFITMTALFAQMPGGAVFGAAFFFLLLVAGLTSQLAMFEVLVASAVDSFGIERRRAVVLGAVVAFLLCVPVILSQGPWSDVRILGMDLFDVANRVSGDYLLAIGGLLISLYVVWVWKWPAFRDETNAGSGRVKVGASWGPFVRFLIPIAVALVLLGGLGLIG